MYQKVLKPPFGKSRKLPRNNEGDLVNWKTANWSLTNMVERQMTYDDICKVSSLGTVLIPGTYNMSAALSLCRHLNGEYTVFTSLNIQAKVMALHNQSALCRSQGNYSKNSIAGVAREMIAVIA